MGLRRDAQVASAGLTRRNTHGLVDLGDLRARRPGPSADAADPEWDGSEVDIRAPERRVHIVPLRSLERVRAAVNAARARQWRVRRTP